ncbi:hypothetical protein KCU85_g6184, partial [Aureobasidium melanogenum]
MATFTEINLFDDYTSDGSIYKWAGDTAKTKFIVEDEQAFLAALSREFNKDNNLVRDFGGQVKFVWKLPGGFILLSHKYKGGKIKEVFGHKSGGHWSSARQFLKHVVSMMGIGGRTLDTCDCDLC